MDDIIDKAIEKAAVGRIALADAVESGGRADVTAVAEIIVIEDEMMELGDVGISILVGRDRAGKLRIITAQISDDRVEASAKPEIKVAGNMGRFSDRRKRRLGKSDGIGLLG